MGEGANISAHSHLYWLYLLPSPVATSRPPQRCVDKSKPPRLVEVYPDGDYDYKDDFAAIGSGSIFGEILLRKLYNPKIRVALAKRLICYIIWETQEIDSNSGEGIQIVSVSKYSKLEKIERRLQQIKLREKVQGGKKPIEYGITREGFHRILQRASQPSR